jgi:pyridinium-3,5-bisthiocarboxylic acid mononucleotide nickel chelatase
MDAHMKVLSLDSVGGASGDMLLGTLVDLGADLDRLAALIQSITPEPLTITRSPASDAGLHGTRIRITPEIPTTWIAPLSTTPAAPEHPALAAGHAHEPIHAGHPHEHPHEHPHDPGHAGAPHAHPHDHDHTHDQPHHEHAGAPQSHDHADGAGSGGEIRRPHAPHRGLHDILALIGQTGLPARTRRLAEATFRRLAEAEARIHNTTPDAIHFHEVGAADAIADIVGCCYALELLGIDAMRIGPLPAGCGTIRCAHGEMPNPAPATQLLLRDFVVTQTDEPFELVTPTGAALLATWRNELKSAPEAGRILASGMGFGSRQLRHRPNVLRATLLAAEAASVPEATLTVLETNLDDANPQWIGDLIERLLGAGARDAWAAPIVMKKGRPALTLGVLCAPGDADALRRLIFQATPTFGIRAWDVRRTALTRRHETVATPYGPVRVKIGEWEGRTLTRTPEFEDCDARAREAGVTPRQVSDAAMRAGRQDAPGT